MAGTGVARRWSAAWSSLPPSVWLLSLLTFIVAVGYGVVVPVLPVLATSFGVGLFEVGLVISALAVGRLALTPLVPRMIGKFGDGALICAGLFLTAGSNALMGLSQSYEQLMVLRFIAGGGSVMYTIASMNLLVRATPSDKRARALGLMQGGFVLGTMLGPALGGALALISISAPFYFYAVSVGLAAAGALLLLRHEHPSRQSASAGRGPAPASSLAEVMKNKGFQAALATNFSSAWSVFGVRTTLVPVIVTTVLHHDPVWTGVAMGVGVGVQGVVLIPVTRFIDSVGRRLSIIIGSLLCAVASIGLALAPNLWLLTLALVVMGVGAAFTGTAPPAAVADAAGSDASRPLALFSLVQDAGLIIGPLVAGLLWDHTTPLLAFGVGAGFLMLSALAGVRMTPDHR